MDKVLILLFACAAIVSCKSNDASEPATLYSINVSGGISDPAYKAAEGDIVNLTPANPAIGYVFAHWTVISDNVEIEGNRFVMPAEDVRLRAEFVWAGFAKISDVVFRDFCKQYDTNHDDLLSPMECAVVEKIDASDLEIETMNGIELFSNLKQLECMRNNLTKLDLRHNKALERVYCNWNNLESINVSENSALIQLRCTNNKLAALNTANNARLQMLQCDENELTSLNVRNNTELTALSCEYNDMVDLDVSNNKSLVTLWCGNQNMGKTLQLTLDCSQIEWWPSQENTTHNNRVVVARE